MAPAPIDGLRRIGPGGCLVPSTSSEIDDHDDGQGLRDRAQRTLGAGAAQRRGIHQSPARRGQDRGRHRARRNHRRGGVAPRRGGGHRHHGFRRRSRVRRRGGRHRRRCHQARADPVRLQGGPAGRHDAQDARGDGQGPSGAHHQAGRPPAQHADHRRDADRQAAANRQRDARDLRAAGPPSRHAGAEAATRGSRVRRHVPEAIRGTRPPRDVAESPARRVSRQGDGRRSEPARRSQHRRRGHRARQTPLEHLRKDDPEGQGVRRDLRHRRHPRGGGVGEGLLRRARMHSRALEARGGPFQGLRRDAEVQSLPEPPHDGDRSGRQAARDPDPHPRDAPTRRMGRGGPLGVQGGSRHPRHRLAEPDHRLANRRRRSDAVHGEPEDRSRTGRDLRVHPQGTGDRPADRVGTGRFRLRRAHRDREHVHRRPGERSTRSAHPRTPVR